MIAATKFAAPRELPIIFSEPANVRAILAGTKTQTRRVVRLPFADEPSVQVHPKKTGPLELTCNCYHLSDTIPVVKVLRPRWRVGDRLWVRETWVHVDDEDDKLDGMGSQTYYRASQVYPNGESDERSEAWLAKRGLHWRPSIFMPRWASRIDLEVTEVRVQRLQDISEEDARAEGAAVSGELPVGLESCRDAFATLWDSINAERGFGWDANPWVWCVSFRRVRP